MGTFSKFSLLLNGSTDYADGGDIFAKLRTDAFSAVGWARTTGTNHIIMGRLQDTAPNRGWEVLVASGGLLIFQLINTVNTNSIQVNSPNPVNTGVWFHFAVCYGGLSLASDVDMYINGGVVTPAVIHDNLTATPSQAGISFNLGARNNTAAHFSGELDDIAIYTGKLNSTQVATIYNAGDPPDLNLVGPTGSVESLWEFDGDTLPTVLDQTGLNDLTITGGVLQAEAPGPVSLEQLTAPTPTEHLEDVYEQELLSTGGGTVSSLFKMRGRDDGRAPGDDYIVWVSSGTPDFAGVGFATGTPTPIGSLIAGSVIQLGELG